MRALTEAQSNTNKNKTKQKHENLKWDHLYAVITAVTNAKKNQQRFHKNGFKNPLCDYEDSWPLVSQIFTLKLSLGLTFNIDLILF